MQTDEKYINVDAAQNTQKEEKISSFMPVADTASLETLKMSKIKNSAMPNPNPASNQQK
jgi:hypothetical protein